MSLPTFSVNPDSLDKKTIKKVKEMVEQVDLQDPDRVGVAWLSSAYIGLIEGEEIEGKDENAIKTKYKGYEYRLDTKIPTVPILTKSELIQGYVGIYDIKERGDIESIEDVVESVDIDYYIRTFKEIKKKIYLQQGINLWRLLESALKGNKVSERQVKEIMEEYSMTDLIEHVMSNDILITRLGDELC